MIMKDFDRKRMDVKLEEVIDRVNAFGAVKQMVMFPPTILCFVASKEAPGIVQLPKCYFSKLMYWVVSSNTKDKPRLEISIHDNATNSVHSRSFVIKENVGEVVIDTKIPNQVLVECTTADDIKISFCFIIYVNDPNLMMSDIFTMKKLSELGEKL